MKQSPPRTACYRETEKNAILKAIASGSSLLVVGETGSGKTALAQFVMQEAKVTIGWLEYSTPKKALTDLAESLAIDLEECKTIADIQEAIAERLQRSPVLLVVDDAHRATASIRVWLERLLAKGQLLLLLATHPPATDIFLKLPRLELKPLKPEVIRQAMRDRATDLGLNFKPSDYARLQERCGGNPMLALRVIQEESLGAAVEKAPDHTEWIDLTPAVIAGFTLVAIVRLVGLGWNNTSLYILGGILTSIAVALRVIYYSLPKKSRRLGQ